MFALECSLRNHYTTKVSLNYNFNTVKLSCHFSLLSGTEKARRGYLALQQFPEDQVL